MNGNSAFAGEFQRVADQVKKNLTKASRVTPLISRNLGINIQQKADAFIALGTVIRGDTPHFDYVCKFVTDGILSLNMVLDAPSIFGVLTVNDEQQAAERIGGTHGNKGEEAAVTAIKMIALNRKLKK